MFSDNCLQLNRAFYGLPRSPLLWFNDLSGIIQKLGLEPVLKCAYLFTNNKLIVFFFVNDICILCHPQNLKYYHTFRASLINAYKICDIEEIKWFLQIRIIQDRNLRKLWLCQDSYIQKIVSRFYLKNNIAKTLIATESLLKYTGQASVFEIWSY